MTATATDLSRFPTRADYGGSLRTILRGASVSNTAAAKCVGCSLSRMTRLLNGKAPLYVGEIFELAKLAGADPLDVLRGAYTRAGLPMASDL